MRDLLRHEVMVVSGGISMNEAISVSGKSGLIGGAFGGVMGIAFGTHNIVSLLFSFVGGFSLGAGFGLGVFFKGGTFTPPALSTPDADAGNAI